MNQPVRPLLSFVIPVRNDANGLRRCLRSIAAATVAVPAEVIVIDNGSTDSSAAVARAEGARVLTIPNLRVAGLRNRGASEAAADLVAFVDADHELGRDWATGAVDSFRESNVAAAGALCFPPPEATWVQRTYDRLRVHEPGRRDVEWLGSGNLVVRKGVFQGLGGFDEALETCEDVDLCQRLTAQGARIVADDRLHSVHFGDPATLKALFVGEMWRGRDNLRVSLRGPLTVRSLPSVAIPVIVLVSLAAIIIGLIAWSNARLLALTGLFVIVAMTLLRAAILLGRSRSHGLSFASVLQAVVVGGTYELARALALVTRIRHGIRRKQ